MDALRRLPALVLLLVIALTTLDLTHAAGDFACADFCPGAFGSPCKQQCAPRDCNPIKGHIKGETILMDIVDGGNEDPAITPLGCCAACKITDGCNGWSLCMNPSGCGSGCKANSAMGEGVDASKRLGQFHQCTDDDKYPYQMCSLMKVANIVKPAQHPNGAKKGWVSGTVDNTVITNCGTGVTMGTCKMCKPTFSFMPCVECAKSIKRVGLKRQCGLCSALKVTEEQRSTCFKIAPSADPFGPAGSGCSGATAVSKMKLPALQKCFDKLFGDCRKSKHAPTCIRCFEKAGAKRSCVTCANLPDIPSRAHCTACVETGNTQGGCACLNTNVPAAHTATCLTCQVKTAAPANDNCRYCHAAKAPSLCYQCVQGAGKFKQLPTHTRAACLSLSDQGTAAGDHADAIACMKKGAKDADIVKGCLQCLENQPWDKRFDSVSECLQAVPKQATRVGKLNTYRCKPIEGGMSQTGVDKECVKCVNIAVDDAAVQNCVSSIPAFVPDFPGFDRR